MINVAVCVQVPPPCSDSIAKLVTVEQSCLVITGSLFWECNSQVGVITEYKCCCSLTSLVMSGYDDFIHFLIRFPVWPQVDAEPYMDMCVEAACSCSSVGDCACFCDVIAAYAQACSEKGVAISWRSNDLCREFSKYPPVSVTFLHNPH